MLYITSLLIIPHILYSNGMHSKGVLISTISVYVVRDHVCHYRYLLVTCMISERTQLHHVKSYLTGQWNKVPYIHVPFTTLSLAHESFSSGGLVWPLCVLGGAFLLTEFNVIPRQIRPVLDTKSLCSWDTHPDARLLVSDSSICNIRRVFN